MTTETPHDRTVRAYRERMTDAVVALNTAITNLGLARQLIITRMPEDRKPEFLRLQENVTACHAELFAFEPPLLDELTDNKRLLTELDDLFEKIRRLIRDEDLPLPMRIEFANHASAWCNNEQLDYSQWLREVE